MHEKDPQFVLHFSAQASTTHETLAVPSSFASASASGLVLRLGSEWIRVNADYFVVDFSAAFVSIGGMCGFVLAVIAVYDVIVWIIGRCNRKTEPMK